MSTSLTAEIELDYLVKVANTTSDATWTDTYKLGTGLLPAFGAAFTDGTTANKAQKHFHQKYTIVAGSPQVLDLNALDNERGPSIDLAKVRVVLVRVRSPAKGQK